MSSVEGRADVLVKEITHRRDRLTMTSSGKQNPSKLAVAQNSAAEDFPDVGHRRRISQ